MFINADLIKQIVMRLFILGKKKDEASNLVVEIVKSNHGSGGSRVAAALF